MKIMLISPKRDRWDSKRYEFWEFAFMTRVAGIGLRKYTGTPLALPIMASLIPEEHKLYVIDENVEDIPYDVEPDLVLLTFFTTSATAGYRIADRFRAQGSIVVIGGCHAAMTVDETLEHADAVATAEAEAVLPQIIKDVETGNLEKIYSVGNMNRPSMDNLPTPRWDLLKLDSYFYPSIQTMRGCPFLCEFCTVRVHWGNKYRTKSIEKVVHDVRCLTKAMGRKGFMLIVDDDIAADRKRSKEMFRALASEKIKWLSQGSIAMANDDEFLSLMINCGGTRIIMGFETISGDSLAEMKKNPANDIKNYPKNILKIQSQGVALVGAFVFGFDHDKKDCFEETTNFIIENNIALPQLFILTPFPGTALTKKLQLEGRILHTDWKYYTGSVVNFIPKNMTCQELQEGYYKAFQKVYSYKSIYLRMQGLWDSWDRTAKRRKEDLLREKIDILLMNKNFRAVAYSYDTCYFPDINEEAHYKRKLNKMLQSYLVENKVYEENAAMMAV